MVVMKSAFEKEAERVTSQLHYSCRSGLHGCRSVTANIGKVWFNPRRPVCRPLPTSARRGSILDVQSVGVVDVSLLMAAVADGDEEVVARLVESGTDPWMSVAGSKFGRTPCPTPLHQACFDGRLDLVQLMLKSRVSENAGDLDPVNCHGQTPLMLAIQSGNVDLVSFLIDIGCDVTASDADENNAMHTLATASVRHRGQGHGSWSPREQREMVRLLTSYGVNVRQRNRYGFTPLRLAALMGNYECVRGILKRRAAAVVTDQSQPDKLENDVIAGPIQPNEHCSVVAMSDKNNDVSDDVSDHRHQLTKALHKLITSRSLKTKSQTTALRLRSNLGSYLQHSPNVDGPSPLLSVTPLYAACVAGDIQAARLLLDVCRADPDREGVCVACSSRSHPRHLVSLPLGVAVLRNDIDLARLLLERGASACRRRLDGVSACRRRLDGVSACQRCLEGPDVATRHCHRDVVNVDRGDDECDLLELALYTDWPISRLLVAAGACVTPTVERFVETALWSADTAAAPSMTSLAVSQLAMSIYEATGNRESACHMVGSSGSGRSTGLVRLSDGESLLQLTRVVIRRSLAPRVLWGVRRLPLPSILKRFVALDEIRLETSDCASY